MATSKEFIGLDIAINAIGRLAWAGSYSTAKDEHGSITISKGGVYAKDWFHGEDQFDGVIPQHIIDKVMRVMGEEKTDGGSTSTA